MNIAFHLDTFDNRGTGVAVYDYAFYNKELLGNNSIIILPYNYKNKRDHKNVLTYDQTVENKFKKQFKILLYKNFTELDKITSRFDVFYTLKSGEKDPIVSNTCKTCVHCVFVCNEYEAHGFIYAAIGSDVCGKNFKGQNTNYEASIVPHMVSLQKSDENLRKELNIPDDSIVFGRYGGLETFDIEFAQKIVEKVANPKTYFLFMNTNKFCDNPYVIFLQGQTDQKEKSKFINTCDAMLHARDAGESFGLAIAEFSIHNKPIITYNPEIPNKIAHYNHIKILGKKGIYYKDEKELESILTTFVPKQENYNAYENFNPEKVMKIFDTVFLKPCRQYNHMKKLYRVKLMCNWCSSKELCKSWSKLGNGTYNYESIHITWSDINIDYYVIVNSPQKGDRYIPKKTIVFRMEPDEEFSPYFNNWYKNRSDFMNFCSLKKYRNNTEWHISKNIPELINNHPEKTKVISTIVSGQYKMPGHKLRIDFIKFLQEHNIGIDIYGNSNPFNFKNHKGSLPYQCKDKGLFPYKYTINAENCQLENYVTEKLVDGILSECLTFYWGCPNVSDFFDSRTYIVLDLNNKEESMYKILQCIHLDEWSKRIQYIREEKRRILKYYNFFTRIKGMIMLNENISTKVINLDRRTDRWENFIKEVKNIDICYERFSAYNKEHIPSFTKLFSNRLKMSDGAKGCAISHYNLWKECIISNKPMLIFEDDIKFEKHFIDRLHILLGKMNKEPWDICFIGWHPNKTVMKAFNISMSNIINISSSININISELIKRWVLLDHPFSCHGGGTFGYIIKPSGALKYLNKIDKKGFIYPVDYEMLCMAYNPFFVKTYLCQEPLVVSEMFDSETGIGDSDIQEKIETEKLKSIKRSKLKI